jgi:hypothetical protein
MDEKMNEKSAEVLRDPSPASTLRDEEYGPDSTAPPSAEIISKGPGKNVEGRVLTRTLSRLRTKDSLDPIPPPPDGGIQAWSQALLCHLVIFKYTCPPFPHPIPSHSHTHRSAVPGASSTASASSKPTT